MEEQLNIEKFNPTKNELLILADTYRNLQINGIEDKLGYAAVDKARKDLKEKRIELQKIGKSLREDALRFQREVITKEKELVGIIEPLEKELKSKTDQIDLEIQKQKRREQLPERLNKLAEINFIADEDDILAMDDRQFLNFYNTRKAEWLEAEQRRIREEQEAKQRELEAEQNRIKAQQDKLRLEQEAKQKEIQEREDAIKAKEAALKAQEEAEQRKKEAEQEKIRLEKEKQEQIKIDKEFKSWLAEHGYTEETKGQYYILQKPNEIILYAQVGIFCPDKQTKL